LTLGHNTIDDIHPNKEDRIYGELALVPSSNKNLMRGRVYSVVDLLIELGAFTSAVLLLASIFYRLMMPVSTLISALIPELIWTEGSSASSIVPWKCELPGKIAEEQTITLEEKDVLDLIYRVDVRKRPQMSCL
jgi:hypothetical protein